MKEHIYEDIPVNGWFEEKRQEEFEDTKWVIGIRKLMKDRQNNGEKKTDK